MTRLHIDNASGQLVVLADRAGRLSVPVADPRVFMSAHMVGELDAGRHHPDVQFDAGADHVNGRGLTGSVLTINAVDRRVVYVLRAYLPGPGCWLAEWPD